MQEQLDFDPNIFRLGTLCKKGHEFKNTNMSLRYHQKTARGACVECRKLSQFKDRQRNAQTILERNRRYRASNAEKVALYNKQYREDHKQEKYEYNKQYVEEDKERVLAARRVYRAKNKKHFQVRQQEFYERNPGYKEIKDRETRARQLGIHSSLYTAIELQEHRQKFNNQCALCGSANAPNMNFVISKSKGGSNTLSNLIPACLSCCCARKSKDLQQWYSAQPFYSKKRWNHILKVLGRQTKTLKQLTLF